MDFHNPAAAPGEVLELATSGVKGVADGNIDVFVRGVQARLSIDHDLAAGERQVDAHVVKLAFTVVPVRRFDQDSTPHDFFIKIVELGRFLANVGLDRLGRRHVAKRHLQREFDGVFLLTRR